MTQPTLKNNTNTTAKLLVLFVFILLSNVSVFGQTINTTTIGITNTEVVSVQKENVSATTSVNFVLWFMGSKQDPNNTISSDGTNTRKQIMTSGMEPNRLLINAFLKKAVNFESTIA